MNSILASAFVHSSEKGSSQSLAQEIANPLTTMIMVPVQYEYNENIGPDDKGTRHNVFVQPIIPFELNDDWNLITRTIVPFIDQQDIFPGSGTQSGMGDITESLFFSPTQAVDGWWIHGFGPVFQFDSATDDYLGLDEHGIGLSYVGLTVYGPVTWGFLINHIYSAEGSLGDTYSNTFFQPFYHYTTEWAMTFELTSESNYNWNEDQWSIPVTLTASQYFEVGDQALLLGGGFKYSTAKT
ncbi:transporter [Catenovulum sp. SM1970]|uniref:transporter n=1 Tax=Marinifaba aquimaris TaxID=2741323 RepID=UPI001572D9CF|nr:transporter [Marinifaba aquimaris]NTS75618.1 transporter [Marinifaba aquimaris]